MTRKTISLYHVGQYIDRVKNQFAPITWAELRESCKYKDFSGKYVYPVNIPPNCNIRSRIELIKSEASEIAFMLKKEIRFSRFK